MNKRFAILLTSMVLGLLACKEPPPNPTGDSPEVAAQHKVKGVSGASGSSPLQVSLGGTGITSSGDAGLVLTSNGVGFYMAPGGGGSGGGASSALNTIGQRLTLTSNTPVTTGNVTGATSVFFTPFQSDTIALDVSGVWTGFETAEISISTTALTAANTYDVFVFPFGSTPTLAFSAAWSGAATRTDALTQVNGVWVKASDNSYRYVGTIYTTLTVATVTAEDSTSHRYLYNFYNQQPRELLVTDTTQFWAYTSAAWRPADNNTANSFSLVLGMAYEQVEITVQACQSASNGGNMSLGVGVDSTTVNSATLYGSGGQAIGGLPTLAFYAGGPGLGQHTMTWLEWGATGGQFYGNVNNLGSQIAGMRGSVPQ